MNKKGVQLKSMMFAILIVGLIVTSLSVWVTGWSDNYGAGITYGFNEYDKSASMMNEVNNSQSRFTLSSPDPGTDLESSTFRSAYGVIMNIFRPLDLVVGKGGMVRSIATQFNIPDYVTYAIISMMVLAIIFAVIAIVFRIPGGRV